MENLKGVLSVAAISTGFFLLIGTLFLDPEPNSILHGLSKDMLILVQAKFVLGYLAGIATVAGFNGFMKWMSS